MFTAIWYMDTLYILSLPELQTKYISNKWFDNDNKLHFTHKNIQNPLKVFNFFYLSL